MLGKIPFLPQSRINPLGVCKWHKLKWFSFVLYPKTVWISNRTALKRQEQRGQGHGCTRASVSGCNCIGERVQAKSAGKTQPPLFCVKKLENLFLSSQTTRGQTRVDHLWFNLFIVSQTLFLHSFALIVFVHFALGYIFEPLTRFTGGV